MLGRCSLYYDNRILFPVAEEISRTETDLIAMIKTTGKNKDYELIEYILNVKTQYTQVLMELNENGAMDAAYIYGVSRLTEDRFTGESNFYLYDPAGNVAGITDQDGYLWQSYRYDAFGNATFGSPQYDNEYMFNAESYNPNIRSQYLRARYYDMVKGNFLTEDSYLGDIRKPLTLNRYSYCIGNPLFYDDPSGHDITDYKATDNVKKQIRTDFFHDMPVDGIEEYEFYRQYNERISFYENLNLNGHWDYPWYKSEEQRISYIVNYDFNSKSGKAYVETCMQRAKIMGETQKCEEILENIYSLWVSPQGMEMIAEFELSTGDAERLGIGEFDENGELIGIYPHYVFKYDDRTSKWKSDGGITFGYGHWVSQWDYDNNENEKALVDRYAFGASFTPPYVSNEGTSYKVSGSSYMPIEEVKELYAIDLKEDEEAVNSFLSTYDIKLSQNQFDALVSFTHQYSTGWWTREPEKQLPKFIREGKGTYEEEVRRIFALHDDKKRRAIEA